MDDPGYFYAFMLVPPLAIALLAQIFVSARSRRKVIWCAALGWVGLIVLGVMLLMALVGPMPDLFSLFIGSAILLGISLVLALGGAILGSELATAARRPFRRQRPD